MENKLSLKHSIIFTLLFGLLCGNAFSSAFISDVRPSKVLYIIGEDDPGKAAITLKNSGLSDIRGTLTVMEEWEIDDSREVWKSEVDLKAEEEKVIDITWDLGSHLYGHGLRASLTVNGKVVSKKAEFFQTAKRENWFRMFMLNGGGLADRETRDNNPFVTYGNFGNHFGYALSDFAALAPEPKIYYSGQGSRLIVKQEMIETIRKSQELGGRHGSYVQSCGAAAAGYELARKHPEWFLRDTRGAFHTVASNRPFSPIDLAYPPDKQPAGWYLLAPDLGNPEVAEFGAKEIVRSIDMFNFDAVFFDSVVYGLLFYPHNQWFPPSDSRSFWTWDGEHYFRGKDPDATSADIQRRVREIIRKSHPKVVLWYNNADPTKAERREQSLAALDDPKSGTLHENQGLQLIRQNYPQHNWRAYFEILVAHRDKYMADPEFPGLEDTIRAVGYMYNRTFHTAGDLTEEEWIASRDTWTTARHVGALYISGTYHPCLTSSTAWRPTTQFMTRYSSFLWDEGIRLMDKPWEKIDVISNREVWWEETVYTKGNDSFHDTIIHLVNSPETENVDIKLTEDPPAVMQMEVEMKLSGDKEPVAVWALTPYDYDDEIREPEAIRITPEISGGRMLFKVPPFTYYTMLVIRETK